MGRCMCEASAPTSTPALHYKRILVGIEAKSGTPLNRQVTIRRRNNYFFGLWCVEEKVLDPPPPPPAW